MTILIVQMAQISNMKVIGLMADFFKKSSNFDLSIGFCGEGQLFAIHHRTQYINAKV